MKETERENAYSETVLKAVLHYLIDKKMGTVDNLARFNRVFSYLTGAVQGDVKHDCEGSPVIMYPVEVDPVQEVLAEMAEDLIRKEVRR